MFSMLFLGSFAALAVLCLLPLGLLSLAFWIWMLIDAIKNPRLDGNQRIIWVLVIIFIPCLGSLIYYFAGRS